MTTSRKTPAKKPAEKANGSTRPAPASPAAAKPEAGPVPTGGEPETPGTGPAPQDLTGLDAMEAELDESINQEVTAAQERQQKAEDDLAAARAGAAMAYGFAEAVLKMRFPYVEIPGEQRGQLIEKATPVFRKYGAELPAWLKPYQEEIELGFTVAATGFGVYLQVQQHRKEEARAQAERRRQAAQQGTDQPSARRVDLSTDNAPEEADAKPVAAE